MKKALSILAAVLAGLCFFAAIALGVVAIWTVGPDSGRFAGTAFVAAVVGAVLTIGAIATSGVDL